MVGMVTSRNGTMPGTRAMLATYDHARTEGERLIAAAAVMETLRKALSKEDDLSLATPTPTAVAPSQASQLFGKRRRCHCSRTLYNGDIWAGYRVADTFALAPSKPVGGNPSTRLGITTTPNKYPGSIASQYAALKGAQPATSMLGAARIMHLLADQKATALKLEEPGSHVVLMHVRIGDVLETSLSRLSNPHELRQPNAHDTKCPRGAWLSNLGKPTGDGLPPQVREIHLVSGAHTPKIAYPYSCCLLETLITDLRSQGYRVKRLPPGSPDEDLARATRYAHFIPTSRGFSALMALMAFLSGRRVHVFSDAPGKSMEEAILCLL